MTGEKALDKLLAHASCITTMAQSRSMDAMRNRVLWLMEANPNAPDTEIADIVADEIKKAMQ